MRIYDRLTLLTMERRADLLFFMCGAGGGRISAGYCGACMNRLVGRLAAESVDALGITTEARCNRACHNCERSDADKCRF